MAQQQLLDLDWGLDDISFDVFALTSGLAPGLVRWSRPDGTDSGRVREAVHRYLNLTDLRAKRKQRTVEELILRRDEDLIGVATSGDQVLIVGRALPIMGEVTAQAVAEATGRGLEYWTLSFYEVVDGVLFTRRGARADRQVAILGDRESFISTGRLLAFEEPIWDGTMRSVDEAEDGEDDEPGLAERLAKAGIADWLAGGTAGTSLLGTPLTVFSC